MKPLKSLTLLVGLMIALTGCGDKYHRKQMEPVPPCESSAPNPAVEEINFWEGKLIYETLHIETATASFSTKRWLVKPFEAPDRVFAPCNLPEAQRIENQILFFSAKVYETHPEVPVIDGLEPIMFTELENGVDGPKNGRRR